jgi:hypothetical protein
MILIMLIFFVRNNNVNLCDAIVMNVLLLTVRGSISFGIWPKNQYESRQTV